MKILFCSFVILFAATSQGRAIELRQDNLGVTLSLGDSQTNQPFVSIIGTSAETKGIDYSDIVNGINTVIFNHTPRCYQPGCLNFQPTEARILPYKSFLKKYKYTDLALVVRGNLQPGGQTNVKTFFIPIETLLLDKKSGDSIHWILTEGNIMTNENDKFDGVNIDHIFSVP